MRAALFLDRDGVLNENRPGHVRSWEEYRFLPGVKDALARAARTEFAIVVVTNQSVIGRGFATRNTVEDIHRRMTAEIAASGGRVDAVYLCPHAPEDGCDCRKPRPGMLLAAAREMGLDLARSWMVGDAATDVAVAQAAGVRPVLVLSGRAGPWDAAPGVPVAADLGAALNAFILR